MTDVSNQRRGPTPSEGNQGQAARTGTPQPWEYERHLEAEHHLLVAAEAGWPTEVKRYRLFRPQEKNRPEQTLLVFDGTSPEAMARFFTYIHPTGQARVNRRAGASRSA
jgi:hypothetical protein